ncbi:hypothetical protein M758_4G114500 [Ceratodon purpureus]|nr:hypothetical protein M758_4G114500 [Ceratodon purpureus]
MGATKVSDEQQASWQTELSHKSHKQDLERQETIPLKPKASLESETEPEDREAAPEPNSKRKAAITCASITLFFGLFALITWLALRPIYQPTYAIDDIQIRALTVNTTRSTVTADILYNVTAHNRNRKMGFTYNWITIDASYSGWNFARSTIPKFKLGKSRNVTMPSWHNVQNFPVPSSVATSLAGAIQNGTVPLRVFAKAKLRVTIGKFRSSPLNVNVDCRFTAVRVPVQSPTSTRAFNVVSKVCRLTRPRYKRAKKLKAYKPANPINTRPRRHGL